MNDSKFSYFITKYFSTYLPGDRGLSVNTIASYRDTFKQLLLFLKDIQNIPPSKMTLDCLTAKTVKQFLAHLECKGKSISTRNQRLAAIKAFATYLLYEDPARMLQYQQIIKIKAKKSTEPMISYLSLEGLAALLRQPDVSTKHGYRDMLLLSLLYDSGARVSEIVQLRVGDLRLLSPCTVLLHGKGGKDRIVPLSDKTAQLIEAYLQREKLKSSEYNCRLLFTNPQGKQLTRMGVSYILGKYANEIRLIDEALIPKPFTPHCIRHTKAMHLLQAGVPLIYIRDFLGHSQIKTTEIYAKADSEQKRIALVNAYPNLISEANEVCNRWKEDSDLVAWLEKLC